jgi:hypothetical protein
VKTWNVCDLGGTDRRFLQSMKLAYAVPIACIHASVSLCVVPMMKLCYLFSKSQKDFKYVVVTHRMKFHSNMQCLPTVPY